MRRLACGAFAALAAAGMIGCGGNPTGTATAPGTAESIGAPLYQVDPPPGGFPRAQPRGPKTAGNPIVVPDCHLAVIDKQDVPSQREGVLRFFVTEIQEGEAVAPDDVLTVRVPRRDERLFRYQVQLGGVLAAVPAGPFQVLPSLNRKPPARRYRRLRPGDSVAAGQLLAVLDDRLARDDWDIKRNKVVQSQAELEASERTRDAAYRDFQRNKESMTGALTSVSRKELDISEMTYERYRAEAVGKRAAVHAALAEAQQADTVLEMHEIYSEISGTVMQFYKRVGEGVKSQEPVLQIVHLDRIRAEGFVDVKHLPRLRKGMKALVEHAQDHGPVGVRTGHRGAVTGVAVGGDPDRPLIASASEDGTVRVWDRNRPGEVWRWVHSVPVRCVACPPASAAEGRHLCLSGAADGKARLWDLESGQLARELQTRHRGAVTCVAFSPDGRWCATGGEDQAILLSRADTGALLYRLPSGHRGAVTSLAFTPRAQLVSAGRDQTVRIWTLGEQGARPDDLLLDGRSGAVTQLGVSPDGGQVLFDQGKALRLLSLSGGFYRGELADPSGVAGFSAFALFSPDAQLVLTAGTDGQAQLWRAPTETTRGRELWRLVAEDRSAATCAAFAPGGAFAVTGTRDQKVLLWAVPAGPALEEEIPAELTNLEPALEGGARQVRLWAELPNPGHRLLPGTAVNLVISPDE
jgi:WD40 repeat protein/biotin carboxyl carrier protein